MWFYWLEAYIGNQVLWGVLWGPTGSQHKAPSTHTHWIDTRITPGLHVFWKTKLKVKPLHLMMRKFKSRKSSGFTILWNNEIRIFKRRKPLRSPLWWLFDVEMKRTLCTQTWGLRSSLFWLLKCDSWSCNSLKYSQMPQSRKNIRQS